MADVKFTHKAECTLTGERVSDPEYVDGKPYMRTTAQFLRDAKHNRKLQQKRKDFKKLMHAAALGHAKES